MHFTLHQLKIFCTVVEKQSITKAAEEMHMTQPAVSIQLKQLQQQFDLGLTEVIGRKLYITDFGKELYQTAMRILQEADTINSHTQRFRGMLTGKLKIAVVSTGKYVMPYYLKDFLQENPAVELVMDVANKTKVVEALAANEVDFSLVSLLPANLALQEETLMPNKLFLAGPAQEKLALPQRPDKSIFGELPLIYREEGSGTRTIMQDYFSKANLSPRIALELTSTEAVKQAVIAGLGYSVLSLLSLKYELKQGEIRLIPVKGLPLRSDWRLVWLTQKKLSHVATAYLAYVRQNKKKIYDDNFVWIEKY